MITKVKSKYFEGDNKISIVFEPSKETFYEHGNIFLNLSSFDSIYEHYINNIPFERRPFPNKTNTQIISISKNSPFEITTLSSVEWITILIFLASVPAENSISNIKSYFRKFDDLVENVEDKFKEITQDFPKFEKGIIFDFLRYYNSLGELQKDLLVTRIKNIGYMLRKIIKIK
jgi:hypothetical protein